jgi:uncharacterized protein (DUF697 family)
LEHSSYTSAERILAAVERREFRVALDEGYSLFDFYEELTVPDGGEELASVTVPFAKSQSPVLAYESEKRVFMRSQAGGAHIDEETGEQISVTNVIVQLASMKVIDNVGRRQVDIVGKGEGFLVTAGAVVPLTWEKAAHETPTEYYDKNGDKLRVNKGKTWICVLQTNAVPVFE